MKEIILKHMLDIVYGDDIEEDAKESFIYFLMACGAYDEFIKHFDIKSFIAYKEIICDNDSYMAFYQIIPHSFSWCGTYHGYAFWEMMYKIHRMILYYKYKQKIIKPNDRVIRKIYVFLFKLNDYFKEIGLK